MTLNARYVHTNIVARDWRRLADFYAQVFGCVPVPPERDYSGEQFDALTGLQRGRLRGMHLRLPGFGEGGPTLEIFEYEPLILRSGVGVNHQGIGHLAFHVDDVQAAHAAVLAAGGRSLGEIVVFHVFGRVLTTCYVTDPEGNAIELQNWREEG